MDNDKICWVVQKIWDLCIIFKMIMLTIYGINAFWTARAVLRRVFQWRKRTFFCKRSPLAACIPTEFSIRILLLFILIKSRFLFIYTRMLVVFISVKVVLLFIFIRRPILFISPQDFYPLFVPLKFCSSLYCNIFLSFKKADFSIFNKLFVVDVTTNYPSPNISFLLLLPSSSPPQTK